MKEGGHIQLISGFLLGILGPPVAFYIFCRVSFPDITPLDQFLSYHRRDVSSHVIGLSVIINLLLFFAFLWMNREQVSRGILGATFLYAFTIAILVLL